MCYYYIIYNKILFLENHLTHHSLLVHKNENLFDVLFLLHYDIISVSIVVVVVVLVVVVVTVAAVVVVTAAVVVKKVVEVVVEVITLSVSLIVALVYLL